MFIRLGSGQNGDWTAFRPLRNFVLIHALLQSPFARSLVARDWEPLEVAVALISFSDYLRGYAVGDHVIFDVAQDNRTGPYNRVLADLDAVLDCRAHAHGTEAAHCYVSAGMDTRKNARKLTNTVVVVDSDVSIDNAALANVRADINDCARHDYRSSADGYIPPNNRAGMDGTNKRQAGNNSTYTFDYLRANPVISYAERDTTYPILLRQPGDVMLCTEHGVITTPRTDRLIAIDDSADVHGACLLKYVDYNPGVARRPQDENGTLHA